ncbi:MAG: major Facilitator Superfamily protein [Betaproteobacteria bacterium]|nr:major Facilitator Superfamily protein [Betaproteobacteria bacterium]
MVLMLSIGTRQSFGLFLPPMTLDLGWTRETFGFAIALQNIVWGLGQPFAGAIADKFGAARVVVVGGVSYALGLAFMACATTGLAFDLSAGILVGLGLSGTGFGVVMGVVGRAAPPEKRSAALGLVGAGGSFGQFAMLPFAQTLISQIGWVSALFMLAACSLLIIPLASALAGRNSAVHTSDQSLSAALREAAAHKGFWLLTVSFLVCGFQTIFVMIHLPAYLVDKGMTPTDGMTALALIGFFNIVGSYACGTLGGHYSKKKLLMALYMIRAVAISLFIALPLSPLTLWAFAITMGVTWLGTVPLTNGMVAQIFGVKYLSTLFSIAFLGHQIGSFLGAWYGGLIFDLTGAYTTVWIFCVVLSVIAAALCAPIDERDVTALRASA